MADAPLRRKELFLQVSLTRLTGSRKVGSKQLPVGPFDVEEELARIHQALDMAVERLLREDREEQERINARNATKKQRKPPVIAPEPIPDQLLPFTPDEEQPK